MILDDQRERTRHRSASGLLIRVGILALACLLSGCETPPAAPTVAAAAAQRQPNVPADASVAAPAAVTPSPRPANRAAPPTAPAAPSTILASVDRYLITREEAVNLLLESHGPALLEQLVVLRGAEALSAQNGITVAEADIQAEHERALWKLVDPLSDIAPGTPDRQQAERLLDALLAEREMSRREYMLSVRLNALLRRLAERGVVIEESDIRAAFEAENGERAEVRHIQLASPREAGDIARQLAAGADFADLARQHSAHALSASRGGLLEPFSQGDERVPALMRESAFALAEGQVSGVLRVGPWHHILRLERRVPAGSLQYEDHREAVRRRLLDRLTEPRMQKLYTDIFRKADVRIHDPILREAFEKRHPDRRGS
jgi:hypothetical protein